MEIDDSEVLRRVAARRSTTGVASAQAQKSAKVLHAAPSFNGDDSTSAGPITERNANTIVGNNGSAPSLKGDPEALKEARDFFQQGVTSFCPPVSRVPRLETTSLLSENTRPEVSKWANFSAEHNKPVSLQGTSYQSFTSNASHASSSSLSTPTTAAAGASKTKADSVDDITSALRSTSITEDSPGAKLAPKSHSKSTGLFDRQISGVNNTLKELKSEMPPPHLRGKAFDQGQSPKTTPSTAVGKAVEGATGAKSPIALEASFVATAGIPQPMLPAASSNAVAKPEAAAAGVSVESKNCHKQYDVSPLQETKKLCESPGKQADPIVRDTDISDTPKATQSATVGVDGDGSGILAKVQKDVKELSENFKNLEAAKVEMEHQLEQLMKKDERRRFMGTGDNNTPFAIDVAYPDGTRRAIQVNVGMKVADLIRRCRVDAKIEAGATSNPRIAVDGSFIGHGQLLGEANVTNGTNKFVAFHYDLV
ncbi:hypothetical protein KC318_g12987 [Hortaea werneckii]|nr:hypothetical protein KC334_g5623 [Hortaea werneckii]KAI7011516.1 hypothetical protein KC355_g5754 [Hortaea werneckii]KAI7185004.1 hypothetical protein KC324_g7536 [Hortaea werneckii]KAI7578047.1 hypothetical protein KC316_g10044 [Hortaea werneckii]KAI7655454.1 hypothetical protein KC318_g12987 [Hortaea werneckii]